MRILVTGGTGHLGMELVRRALDAGHDVRVAGRRSRPALDLATGAGLPEALDGVEAVVHAASDPKRAAAVDVEGTGRLAEAARAAGVRHFVHVSIVGIDRIPYPYYMRKLEAEQALAASGAAFSILRATQFHALVDHLIAAAARMPLVLPLAAGFHVQSVDTGEVATRILRALDEGPAEMLPDFGGPEKLTLADAARAWRTARGVRKPIVPIPFAGRAAAAFRSGFNTPDSGERGSVTWTEWLADERAPRYRS